MIKADDISKSYVDGERKIDVLAGLSFDIAAGQTIALMGQSGSGKSTLLHLLGGFDRPSSGHILLKDQDITTMNDDALGRFRRLHLGMIFQQYNLIPCLSAKDNITFVRRLNGLVALDDTTDELIDLLGLTARLDHYPNQLSGGEQQRVAIARALAANPSLILADEPTGNLDEKTADEVMALLTKAVALNNSTLLLVTHSRKTAEYLEQIWHLEQGQLRC